MIRHIALLLAIALFLPVGFSFAAGEREQEALDTAKQWVTLVDAKNYAESWEEAAQVFRDAISRADWVKSLEMVRTPLGKVVTRKFRNSAYVTSLPGAPKGEYVVLEFDTSFQNKTTAIETITPARDSDGRWRVAGYYIR